MSLAWTKRTVTAQEILDAVATLVAGQSWHQIDLVSGWTSAESYLGWARECLNRNDAFGWDAAISYAKRAACRQIDALIVTNHFGHFAGRNYPEKLQILTDIDISAPELIHELVIDPRNDIEHEYIAANAELARKAVDLCDLFLRATRTEAGRLAVISLGAMISFRRDQCTKPGHERDIVEFDIKDFVRPMLFIDCEDPQKHTAMILRPKDAEIFACPMKAFSLAQTKDLAKILRRYHELTSFSNTTYEMNWWPKLKSDLNLPR